MKVNTVLIMLSKQMIHPGENNCVPNGKQKAKNHFMEHDEGKGLLQTIREISLKNCTIFVEDKFV